MMEKNDYTTIDGYIAQSAPEVQERLKTLRQVIKAAAPGAEDQLPDAVL
jgi:uncharacterized protein YdhG (YjbR/CyaY superfamily)